MNRVTSLVFLIFSLAFWPDNVLAISFSSDTSFGNLTFVEDLAADGDFQNAEEKKAKEEKDDSSPYGIWDVDYVFTKTKTLDSSGNALYDETTELDFGGGAASYHHYEFGGGLTFANTPQENLKDWGPNMYFEKTFLIGEKSKDENFQKMFRLRASLSNLIYVQTFSTTFTSRLGVTRPITGTSSIDQFFPKIEATYEASPALTLALGYTYYFYNRDVPGFLAALDSPRAVAVGLGNLGGSVSGFNVDQIEVSVNWYPLDRWEFDFKGTQANSAVNLSSGYSEKYGFIYELGKYWKGGLAMQYDDNYLFTDHIYTLTFKFNP